MEILLLSGDPLQREAIIAALRNRLGDDAPYEVRVAPDIDEARHALRQWPINIFVSVADDRTINLVELVTPQLVAYRSFMECVIVLDYDEAAFGPLPPGVITINTVGGEYEELVDAIVVGFENQANFDARLVAAETE